MTRSTYFDLGRSADACPGSESGYAQRFQCGNVVERLIRTGLAFPTENTCRTGAAPKIAPAAPSSIAVLSRDYHLPDPN